jgi:hypothetical protein
MVLLALAGCGFWIIGSGVSLGWRIHRIRQWPTTPGTVAERKSDHLNYVYEVAGISHQGQREGEFAKGQYAPGTTVTVHYNPANPDQAVLQTGDHVATALVIGLGVALLLLCSPFLFYYGALAYCDIMLVKMRYHLRQAQQAMEEGDAMVNQMYEEHGSIPDDLAAKRDQTLAQAADVARQMREVEELLSNHDDDTRR